MWLKLNSAFMKISKAIMAITMCFALTHKTNGQADHLKLILDFQKDSTLNVIADYTIQSRKSDSVYFILNPGFQPLSITSEGLIGQQMAPVPGRPFPFWMLLYNEESKKGKTDIRFQYSIDLKQMNHIKSNWIELNVDKLWFPNYDDLDNEFTWEARVNGLYEQYSLVSYQMENEEIVPVIHMLPKGEITLKNNEPTPEVFFMAGANMQLWTSEYRNEKTKLFVSENQPDSMLHKIAGRTDEIIDFYNTTFNSDRINDYLLILRNTEPGEINFLQSRKSILLGNTFASGYSSLSHEVSHYWWSDADFINEPWMNESFANYSMLLFLESMDSTQFHKQWNRIKEGAVNGGSLRNTTSFDPNGMATYYFKGSQILWQLANKIGRDQFVKLLTQRIGEEINSTDLFLELIGKSHGERVMSDFALKLK